MATMKNRRAYRPAFDREREFVVTRLFPCNGVPQIPEQPFDKTQVTVRTLRNLYEQRFIHMEGNSDLGKARVPLCKAIGPRDRAADYGEPVRPKRRAVKRRPVRAPEAASTPE